MPRTNAANPTEKPKAAPKRRPSKSKPSAPKPAAVKAAAPKPTPTKANPAPKAPPAKAKEKAPAGIRVARVKSKAGREILLRVSQDGQIVGARDRERHGVERVKAWFETGAMTWKEATASVKAGAAREVRAKR